MSILLPEFTVTSKQFFTNETQKIEIRVFDGKLYVLAHEGGSTVGGTLILDALPPSATIGEYGTVTSPDTIEGEYTLAVDSANFTEDEMDQLALELEAELALQFPGTTINVLVIAGSLRCTYKILPDDISTWDMTAATATLDTSAKSMLKEAATKAGLTSLAADIESDAITLTKVAPVLAPKVLKGIIKSVSLADGILTVVTVGSFKSLFYSVDDGVFQPITISAGSDSHTVAVTSEGPLIKVRLFDITDTKISHSLGDFRPAYRVVASVENLLIEGSSVLSWANAAHQTEFKLRQLALPISANTYDGFYSELIFSGWIGKNNWSSSGGGHSTLLQIGAPAYSRTRYGVGNARRNGMTWSIRSQGSHPNHYKEFTMKYYGEDHDWGYDLTAKYGDVVHGDGHGMEFDLKDVCCLQSDKDADNAKYQRQWKFRFGVQQNDPDNPSPEHGTNVPYLAGHGAETYGLVLFWFSLEPVVPDVNFPKMEISRTHHGQDTRWDKRIQPVQPADQPLSQWGMYNDQATNYESAHSATNSIVPDSNGADHQVLGTLNLGHLLCEPSSGALEFDFLADSLTVHSLKHYVKS